MYSFLPLRCAKTPFFFKGCIINHGGWKVEEIPTAGGRKGLCHGARASLESTLPLVWSKPVLAQAGEL